MANNRGGLKDWIPLVNKLVWPVFIVIFLLVFHQEVGELYGIFVKRVKAGSAVKLGGFLELGELAQETEIGQLRFENISVEGLGVAGGVVRKESLAALEQLKEDLRKNPSKTIDTLLLTDEITYSVNLIEQYIGALGLRYVVFQRSGKFEGWTNASTFVAQLESLKDRFPDGIGYDELKNSIVGINQKSVLPTASAKQVLEKMQEVHLESLPVVDSSGKWKYFVSREEILSQLITSALFSEDDTEGRTGNGS